MANLSAALETSGEAIVDAKLVNKAFGAAMATAWKAYQNMRWKLAGVRRLEVVDDVADGVQASAVLIGYVDAERTLQSHGEFHRVQRVGSEVLLEAHLSGSLHPKLIEHHLLHLGDYAGIWRRLRSDGLRRKHPGGDECDETYYKLPAGRTSWTHGTERL